MYISHTFCLAVSFMCLQMTGYDDNIAGLGALAGDFLRLRGRLEASPFHFINLGVLAYIGTGQASGHGL